MACIRALRWPTALLALTLFAGDASGIEPVWQALPAAPTAPRIDDVWFLDENMGWTFANGATYRTLDGGVHWQHFPAPGVSMRSITFSSPSHGWIGSLAATPLWASVDSGKTWSEVTLPEPRPQGICGLWSVNADVVYGCGRYDRAPTVIKTTDAGAHWETADLSGLASGLVDCRFFDPDSGFIVGRVGVTEPQPRVLFTGDGGKTWDVRYTGDSPAGGFCWKISFPSRRIGFVSIDGVEAGWCLRTLDGGRTWTEIPIPVLHGVEGIGFVNEFLGWACDEGRPHRTTDGGLHWELERFGGGINRIRFLGSTIGYSAGQTIYKYSIPTTTDRATWTGVKSRFRP